LLRRGLRCINDSIMAKIFYCGGSCGRLGTLRAVIQLSDLSGVLSKGASNYVGQSFPEANQDGSARVVIEIGLDEEEATRRSGFYVVQKSPIQIETILRTCGDRYTDES
jgi:hypothetical protein